jgi:hypothetical protein
MNLGTIFGFPPRVLTRRFIVKAREDGVRCVVIVPLLGHLNDVADHMRNRHELETQAHPQRVRRRFQRPTFTLLAI